MLYPITVSIHTLVLYHCMYCASLLVTDSSCCYTPSCDIRPSSSSASVGHTWDNHLLVLVLYWHAMITAMDYATVRTSTTV